MRGTDIARDMALLKRDRTSHYMERLTLSPGRVMNLYSRRERDWWEGFLRDLATGHVKPHDFSIKDLFESLVKDGAEMIRTWDPRNGPDAGVSLMEAAGAVTSSDFSNITGQIIYNALIQQLTPEEFPFQKLIPTTSTQFNGEKIAGIAGLGDQAETVAENDEFPFVGTGEDWIETPATTKRGFIVPITKEALFFDRTGQVLQKAGAVGESLRLNKEKRAIDCVIDQGTTTHRYKWRGTTYGTYQTATPWINVTTGNALVDWTDIDNADQTFNAVTDPNTGEPVAIEADTLICCKLREQTARRIRNAAEITVVTPGYATSGNATQTKIQNPMGSTYEVISSRLLASRLTTDTDWFYGNPRRAFTYMENWPITVTQAPAGNSDDFNRDIVAKFKCSERGQYATIEPRVMGKSTEA